MASKENISKKMQMSRWLCVGFPPCDEKEEREKKIHVVCCIPDVLKTQDKQQFTDVCREIKTENNEP